MPSHLLARRLLPLALCLVLLLGASWQQRPDGRLHVTLLPTTGDAAVIQTPAGHFVLIDGGSDPAMLALQLGRRVPFWEHSLAATVLTAPDGKRLPGQVAALARYAPAIALAPAELAHRGTAGEWRRLVAASGARAATLRPGQRLALDGATLTVLAAEPGEHGGAVLLLHYGRTRVVLHTGGPAGDEALLAVRGPVDLLVYPWQRDLDNAVVAALRPQAIAFTTAYEAPASALLSYAERRRFSPRLYHPANDGAVELLSDGRRAWIVTEE